MKRLTIFLLAIFLAGINLTAQNVGIGTAAPDANAILDVNSTNKGLLIPRVQLIGTNLPNPLSAYTAGIIVYNTATTTSPFPGVAVSPGFYYCTSSGWKRVSDDSSSWLTTGNDDTNSDNFIGNNNFSPLTFKTNGQQAGLITLPQKNTFFGYTAGFSNPGFDNVAIGDSAFYSGTTGNGNTAVGTRAMRLTTTGGDNIAVGLQAMMNNTTGSSNVAIGTQAGVNFTGANGNVAIGAVAMQNNQIGNFNTAIGIQALNANTADGNTALGAGALAANTIGFNNTAVGFNALTFTVNGVGNSAVGISSLKNNVSGNNNTAMGVNALLSLQSGSNNTAIGVGALRANTIESANTAVGFQTLFNNTGTQNTALGNLAGNLITTGSNNITIGSDAQVPTATGSNQVRIGNANISYAAVQVAWTITSDKRYKSFIRQSNLGLDFINQLQPVSYFRNNDKSERTEYGFIAQDVDMLLKRMGAANTGIISTDDAGMYSMRYNDLIAPMVKAIQEQQTIINQLSRKIEQLEKLIQNR